MKKMSIVINGQHEEEIGLEILQGIYAAIQNHGYEDVQGQLRGVAQLSAVLQADRSPQEHGSKEGEAE